MAFLGNYILAPDSNDVCRLKGGEDEIITWARWFESNKHRRRVAFTEVAGIDCSTVFLGVDHSWSLRPGVGLVFETMLCDRRNESSDLDNMAWRYCCWHQAARTHDRIVATLREGAEMPSPDRIPDGICDACVVREIPVIEVDDAER